ncbi:MAG: carboxypeptidase family protein [Gammaproteobacteria bacterium]|nr:carboxypeptidase family protein [Gammaproteobacteria bacterium]
MHINSTFSSGNIDVVDINESSNQVQLKIHQDNNSDFKQWFHFKVNNALNRTLTFQVSDAKDAAYPDGWENYNVCCSLDGEEWFRIPTDYKDGVLTFEFSFEESSAYFAYFAPYSYERHLSLVHQAACHPLVEHSVIGQSLDGREINLLRLGNPSAKHKVWLIARQHPGETMAEWFMEGVIGRLLDYTDATANQLLNEACLYLVPNMNPDGTERGHLRTNANGVNLNREWNCSTPEQSPEVYCVRDMMLKEGVTMFIDVHGDEGLPYVFLAGSEGIPSYNDELSKQEEHFKQVFKMANPDFQDEFGYPKDSPGEADLSVASSWVAEQFKCFGMTLEMPFKDNANAPDVEYGWSPERSIQLGETILTPILSHVTTF